MGEVVIIDIWGFTSNLCLLKKISCLSLYLLNNGCDVAMCRHYATCKILKYLNFWNVDLLGKCFKGILFFQNVKKNVITISISC